MGRKKMLQMIRHKMRKRNAGRCESKVRYTFAEAQLQAPHYRKKAYKCPICGGWHLTTPKGR